MMRASEPLDAGERQDLREVPDTKGFEKCSTCGTRFEPARYPNSQHCSRLCACVSEDAARCIALRYPEHAGDWDETEPEVCHCSCHDFQRYDE